MRSLPALLIALLAPAFPLAQDDALPTDGNLVPNGGFETVKGKLKKEGAIAQATGWVSPTESKADLFGGAVEGTPIGVPKNVHGDQSPLAGEHYAGVRWWSQMDRQPRSYLQVQLTSVLQGGRKYCVKYNVSLGDLSRYGSNEIGAFLSPIPIEKDDASSLTYAAQVPADRSAIIADMQNWKGVCGIHEAKGDEQYLIIGNFAATDKTLTQKMKRPKGEVRPQVMEAYYFIDEVSVMEVASAAECSCAPPEKKGEAAAGIIFSRSTSSDPGLSAMERLDKQIFYFKPMQATVDKSMEPWITETAALLTADGTLRIRLVGHIDAKEKEAARLTLGASRAEAVKAALEAAGADGTRISVEDRGPGQPMDIGTTEVALSKNRRVEVEIVP